MRTTTIIKLLLATVPYMVCHSANAQKDDYSKQCKINLQIENDIKTLIADTTDLYQTIVKFDTEQMHLNVQIDSIEFLCNELRDDINKDNIADIQQNVDSLSDVLKKLQERKNELDSMNSQKESTLSKLKNNISDMGVFSELKYEQMYTQYQEILTQPYSVITKENISEIESKLNLFTNMSNFEEFNARLKSCKKNKELYDSAETLLKSKFDADIINKTRNQLYELLIIKKNDFDIGIVMLSDAQYSEIDTLDIRLSRYENGITFLQNIVKTVNGSNIREQYKDNKDDCIDAMRSIVTSEETDEVEKRQRYFDMIPSLKKLYHKYWNELQVNPFTYPTESERKIMQLNNELK